MKREDIITNQTNVEELIKAHPETETLLKAMVPPLEVAGETKYKLVFTQNTTLEQAARVGNVKADVMASRLRKITGQADLDNDDLAEQYDKPAPAWFDIVKVKDIVNIEQPHSAEETTQSIIKRAEELEEDTILEVKSFFVPAGLLDAIEEHEWEGYIIQPASDEVQVFIYNKLRN